MTETPVIYVCSIPAVPLSLNEWKRMTMFPAARAQKAWQELVWAVVNEKGNRCPRGLAHIDLHAVLMFPEMRRRDASNYGAVLWKFTLDTLVREGVIADDTAEYASCHEPKIMTGGKPLTLITLEGHLSIPGQEADPS